jgi:hypothetical protein
VIRIFLMLCVGIARCTLCSSFRGRRSKRIIMFSLFTVSNVNMLFVSDNNSLELQLPFPWKKIAFVRYSLSNWSPCCHSPTAHTFFCSPATPPTFSNFCFLQLAYWSRIFVGAEGSDGTVCLRFVYLALPLFIFSQ